MSRTSTTENLFLYLFNETPLADTVLIQREIDNDPLTEAEFEDIKSVFKLLDRALVAPSRKSIDKIMTYACESAN